MSEQQAQTPLIDLLRGVPEDARHSYEHGPTHHQMIPYGRHCRSAADEIVRLEEEADALLKVGAQLKARAEAADLRAFMLARALERQTDNMAWVINHVLNGAWADKFSTELAEDRAALSRLPAHIKAYAAVWQKMEMAVYHLRRDPTSVFTDDALRELCEAHTALDRHQKGTTP